MQETRRTGMERPMTAVVEIRSMRRQKQAYGAVVQARYVGRRVVRAEVKRRIVRTRRIVSVVERER